MPKISSSNCTLLIRNALITLSRLDVKTYKRNNRLSVFNVTKHKHTKHSIVLCEVDGQPLVYLSGFLPSSRSKVRYIAQIEIALFRETRSKNNVVMF